MKVIEALLDVGITLPYICMTEAHVSLTNGDSVTYHVLFHE